MIKNRSIADVSKFFGWLVILAVAVYAGLNAYSHLTVRSGHVSSKSTENWIKYASAGRRSMLILVHSQCSFCQAERAFYRKLAEVSKKTSAFDVHLLMSNNDPGISRFSKEIGVVPNVLTAVEINHLKMTSTPTLLVVSDHNQQEYLHVGALDGNAKTALSRCLATNRKCP